MKSSIAPFAILAIFALMTSCATTSTSSQTSSEASSRASRASSESPDPPQFGDDPMGAARRWIRAPERRESASSDAMTKLEDPVIARLYRHPSGQYRAVVTEADSQKAPALLLTLERRPSGEWRVTEVTSTESTHLWPEM